MSPAEVIPLLLPKIGCKLLLTFLFFSIAYDRFQWLSMVFIEFAIVSIENRLFHGRDRSLHLMICNTRHYPLRYLGFCKISIIHPILQVQIIAIAAFLGEIISSISVGIDPSTS
ncbi:hypothetical protein BpHYR1_039415 [Brachionus plicatilis]|uniref:Uncharacterized protein n=1 Tax=Brachionus plicatilis TaxID=10195 RepID=A0A3M7QRK1_BRAPC|nr:hypothetical protein BpHYR1_039415 [Brachionus plicatilis]